MVQVAIAPEQAWCLMSFCHIEKPPPVLYQYEVIGNQ